MKSTGCTAILAVDTCCYLFVRLRFVCVSGGLTLALAAATTFATLLVIVIVVGTLSTTLALLSRFVAALRGIGGRFGWGTSRRFCLEVLGQHTY
jgi:hypothetical protein